MIDFTFGIVTSGNKYDDLNKIIDSIENQDIPNYEIIIVGNCEIKRKKTKLIEFDESIKTSWITRKKNIITNYSQFENIVYLHDYIKFHDDWYKGFLKFGNNFDICMNRIINCDGTRYRDWCLCMWNDPNILNIDGERNGLISEIVEPGMKCLLPYDEDRFTKHMYFSGAYWVAKKNVMLEFPLNEKLIWGQGEDVIWSMEVREKYKFSMNKYSTVELLKYKDAILNSADNETIQKLEKKLLTLGN
jgi:glycosyltransferase involved in cell wall biosynthesis